MLDISILTLNRRLGIYCKNVKNNVFLFPGFDFSSLTWRLWRDHLLSKSLWLFTWMFFINCFSMPSPPVRPTHTNLQPHLHSLCLWTSYLYYPIGETTSIKLAESDSLEFPLKFTKLKKFSPFHQFGFPAKSISCDLSIPVDMHFPSRSWKVSSRSFAPSLRVSAAPSYLRLLKKLSAPAQV